MDEHQHHEDLISEISGEYTEILNDSGQGVYIYLDDNHKICNDKFAKMLGYETPESWANVTEPFAQAFVQEESQEVLVSAFQDATEKMKASQNSIVWKTKSGEKVETKVILVPIAFKGHLLALHFVNEK